jgi:hypothetical protein
MELLGLIYQVWQLLEELAGAGWNSSLALAAFGGDNGVVLTNTEEWTGEVATANSKTLTTS